LSCAVHWSAGYKQARDHPVIQELTHHIQEYNDALEEHGLHDHQVGRIPTSNARARRLLIERTWLLLVYCLVAIPGGILWLPIWLVSQRVCSMFCSGAWGGGP
jgi:glycerol-3-phosphate O-acyltransferase/dihydroxyacetone phosphate acyltransferase